MACYYGYNYLFVATDSLIDRLYVIRFAKRGLIHASNFTTLRMCNSAHVLLTTLKFGTSVAFPIYMTMVIQEKISA